MILLLAASGRVVIVQDKHRIYASSMSIVYILILLC